MSGCTAIKGMNIPKNDGRDDKMTAHSRNQDPMPTVFRLVWL